MPLPLSNFIDLSGLSESGQEVVITPNAGQRTRLAEWAGVDAIDHFEGRAELRRLSPTRFAYHGEVRADVVQGCVITLEPVRSHLEFGFSRELQLVRRLSKAGEENIAPEAADDDMPEQIADPRYDVAGPLLEEFALAIDPYPRAPGVIFRPSHELPGELQNPFAVLKDLKKRG